MIIHAYQSELDQKQLTADASQADAVQRLQDLYDDLVRYQQQFSDHISVRLKHILLGKPVAPKGIYLWGDVGRGKTWLMDMFYSAVPFEQKTRLHFHHFMLDVHAQLAKLQQESSSNKVAKKNPLSLVARAFADHYSLICLDEFIVTNITDAMLLYGLLDELFKQGVVLVATSNRVPDDLYLNGLQRDRFLPAITLINGHTQVVHLDSQIDHRIAMLERTRVYHCPLSPDTDALMQQQFDSLAETDVIRDTKITIQKREIPVNAISNQLIWFEFEVLCNTPRATPDYIDIADQYRIVMLSNVPVMDEDMDDKARRFIYLIDELYDKKVTLLISAQENVDDLYQGDMLAFAFKRTRSRLIEMRSDEYLSHSRIGRI